ncbi:MAG: tRNA lysidine(34) synthetase TilS [Cyclonatronaceae bacterium]
MNRSGFSAIEKAFTASLAELPAGVLDEGIVAAVSGGCDSMVMLHLFHLLNIRVTVAHINYARRGSDSDQDEELVKKTAGGYGYDIRVLKADPNALMEGNFQDNARKMRYRFLVEVMQEHARGAIALAHHEDDQIETILFKILRGAGPVSWKGMKVWEEELLRPLLYCSRNLIETYAADKKIRYRIDSSNLSANYARNFLRLSVFPELSEKIPGFRQNILKLPKIVSSIDESLKWIARRIADEKGRIPAEEFLEMDMPLRKALIHHLVRHRFYDISLSTGSLERLSECENLQTGKFLDLAGGIVLYRDKDHFILEKKADTENIHLDKAPDDKINIRINDLEKDALNIAELVFELDTQRLPFTGDVIQLDADKLPAELTIRYWKAGDRFTPLGMNGTQLVSDHLTGRKITGSKKKEARVLSAFDGTVCAVIFPVPTTGTETGTIDNRFALDGRSKRILRIYNQ